MEQSPNNILLKRILSGLVLAAGTGTILFPAHTIAHHVCAGIVAFGAALGITSSGVPAK